MGLIENPALKVVTTKLEVVLNWARARSLWPLMFSPACCAFEMLGAMAPKYDWFERSGALFRASPRQSDLMIVAGTVTYKLAPTVKLLYEQMPDPKWVIAMGSCSVAGGPFYDSYAVVRGVDNIVPVDIYVPGCPPHPEALCNGFLMLQEKIMDKKLTK